MKNSLLSVCFFVIISMAHKGGNSFELFDLKPESFTDTIPNICNIIPPLDMEVLNPFTTRLTTTFPDPNNFETYSGCQYQFFTADEKPQIAIRLIKWESKKEAANEFMQQVKSHFDHQGITPERIYNVADSAYFGYEVEEPNLCDECGLVAILGPYSIYISFKGQYKTVTRTRKKESALKILQLMYDRIPVLTALLPSRIRNRQ